MIPPEIRPSPENSDTKNLRTIPEFPSYVNIVFGNIVLIPTENLSTELKTTQKTFICLITKNLLAYWLMNIAL